MNRSALLFAVAAWVLGVLPCRAQIYADFTVSHGGTTLGTFTARLDYDKAPRTCANFIGLATGQRAWIDVTNGQIKNTPFYDGLTFHRLIHNFMIQGGSSDGAGSYGAGFVIRDEFHPDLRHDGRYILSMANTGLPHTGGAQFFITLEDSSHLDDKHSVFGEVIDGKDIIDGFTNATNYPTTGYPKDTPLTPIVMDSVVISGPSLAGFDIDDPALNLPQVTPILGELSIGSGNEVNYTVGQPFTTGQQLKVFRSPDLMAWAASDDLFFGADTVVSFGQIDSIISQSAFYRLSLIDYPDSLVRTHLANRIWQVTRSATDEVFNYSFDATGHGGTCIYSGGGSVDPNGSISTVSYTPNGYGLTLVITSSNLGSFLYRATLLDEDASQISGPANLSYWNGFQWVSLGAGAATLSK